MTFAELHKILDDENKKLSLEEYQEVLFQLKNDTIAFSTREEFDKQEQTAKFYWYNGETNAFQIALDLSEHISQTQKVIEYLKEVKEKLSEFCGYDLDNDKWFITEEMFKYLIDQIEKGEKE